MPSILLGFQSGGAPLCSGDFFSGRVGGSPRGIFVQNAWDSSGAIYLAWSGNVTITSGGMLSSGGTMDGREVGPGRSMGYPLPPGGPASVYAICTAGVSGRVRLFWDGTGQ